MLRRHAALALFALASSLLVAGCGGGDQGPAPASTTASDQNVEDETRAADEAMQKALQKKGGR